MRWHGRSLQLCSTVQRSDAAIDLEPLFVPLDILLGHAGVDLVYGLQAKAHSAAS